MNTKPLLHGGMIVLVLLVILGALSLGALGMTSAYADLKLARTAAQRAEGYYELERLVNEELQRVNGLLADGLPLDGWAEDGNTFSCNISLDGQNLYIELMKTEPDAYGRYYTLLAWRQWQDGFEYETEGTDIWQE